MITTVVVVLGAFCGGFVTGLAGFGTGLTALAFWLHVVDPVVAAALVVTCSVVGQTQSLFTVRREISWRRAWPFLAGGVIGVPLGAASLQMIAPQALKVILGILLVGYTVVMLGAPAIPDHRMGREGRGRDGRLRRRGSRRSRGALRPAADDLVRAAGMDGRRPARRVSAVST